MMISDANHNTASGSSSDVRSNFAGRKLCSVVDLPFINNMSGKILLKELPTSSIYEVTVSNRKYIYKVIRKNPDMDFSIVSRSYRNYNRMKNKDKLVEVYDYRVSDDAENFEVLMEYLEEYYDVESIKEENRLQYAEQVFEIIENVVAEDLIPVDCGLANFVTNGNTVKMLDLDFILSWDQVSYFNTRWFESRLEEIKNWCPSISEKIDNFISEFVSKKKHYFLSIPYNPLTQKIIEDGEQLLVDGNNGKAIEYFQKALRLTPDSASSYNNLAVAYWNLDETERALPLLKIAVELEPRNKNITANYIDVLNSQKMYDEIEKVSAHLTKISGSEDLNYPQLIKLKNIQSEIDSYSYPSNYAYDIVNLKPKGSLETRIEYFVKYCPEIFEPCNNFLSVGSSLGYMLLFHSHKARKCVGIEPDRKANEIVKKVCDYRNVNNIELFTGTFKDFKKKEKYDLIWMGNVFQYMYVDYGWEVARELAEISDGRCIIEAPFEGEFLKQQAHLNANWKNEILMNNYTFARFESEMNKYFNLVSINPSGTDPVNRLIVVLSRKN